jgi:hypothetical protein
MGAGGIYLIRNKEGNEVLVEMRPTPYDREDILQALIARFPNLLAGDAADAADQRWLLVGREAALPDDEDGGGRWSVDHLFLDQDAVPTLVEVKRAKDTRIRREVVGQVLDYAANAVVYWPIERLRELFLRECERSGSDPEELVAAVIGADGDVEEFWQRANEKAARSTAALLFWNRPGGGPNARALTRPGPASTPRAPRPARQVAGIDTSREASSPAVVRPAQNASYLGRAETNDDPHRARDGDGADQSAAFTWARPIRSLASAPSRADRGNAEG